MRIAFAYDVPYPWHIGGIEAMNFNEAEELAKDHDVHYFTTKWPGMKGNEFTYKGIKYHAYGETSQDRIYRHGRRSIREAVKYTLSVTQIYRHKFDVVITNAFPILHLPFLKLYCKLNNAKLIIQVAEVWDHKYWKEYLGNMPGSLSYAYSKSAMSGADHYITISSATTRNLVKFGMDPRKISQFAPAVDDSLIKGIAKGKARKERLIMFSGRLIKEKRIALWLSIFKGAYSQDKRLRGLIVGSGPDSKHISDEINGMGLKNAVRIRNYYPRIDGLYRQIKRSMAVLHTSSREGLGIIAIEGIMLNTPVLLPSDSPIPDEIKRMCTSGSSRDLEKSILKLSQGGSLAARTDDATLRLFSKSSIRKFYSDLFRKIDA